MSRSLARDERGAILVLGLFMSIFLLGCVYYVVGIGDAITQRERMQAAADAAALSGATLHARGMNLIALVNIVMAAMMAVLIALKLISLVAKVAIATIMGCSLFFGVCAPMMSLVPELAVAGHKADSLHGGLLPHVHSALRVLNAAARGVRASVPYVAQARVFGLVRQAYAPPALGGLAIPTRASLPTKNGTYEELCDRGGKYVGGLVGAPFTVIGGDGVVEEIIEEVIDGAPGWFCRGDGKAPETTQKIERWLPQLPEAAACEAYAERPDGDRDHHAWQCERAARESEQSTPDEETGSCTQACGEGEPYDLRVTLAREQCRPGVGSLDKFEWQERDFYQEYVFEKGRWKLDTRAALDPGVLRRKRGSKRPCGTRNARIAPTWNTTVREEPGAPVQPLCSNAAPPEDDGEEGERVTLEHTEVVHVLGCAHIEERTFKMDEGKGGLAISGDGSAMAPQVLQDEVVLGTDTFQLRGMVLGELPESSLAAILATIGVEKPGVLARAPMQLGRLSLAQAEYYCATGQADELGECLWRMDWRARLRRLRLPEGKKNEKDTETAGEAGSSGPPDAETDSARLGLDKVIVHPESACSSFGDAPCELFHSPLEALH